MLMIIKFLWFQGFLLSIEDLTAVLLAAMIRTARDVSYPAITQ